MDHGTVERAVANVKHWMRDAQQATVDDTWRYLGDLLGTVKPQRPPKLHLLASGPVGLRAEKSTWASRAVGLADVSATAKD